MISEKCSFRNRSVFFVQTIRTMFRFLCKLLFCLKIWLMTFCWLNVLTWLMRTSCVNTTYVQRIAVVENVMSCKSSLSCFILSFVFSKRASSFKSSLSRRLINSMSLCFFSIVYNFCIRSLMIMIRMIVFFVSQITLKIRRNFIFFFNDFLLFVRNT
jgi:hypothetical protein